MSPLEIKTIEAGVEEARNLLSAFLGPAAAEAGAIMGDHVRQFRLKQQIKLLGKAKQRLKDAGLTPKAVSLKVLLPLLETAALEDDEDMAQRWASLLASAADPNNTVALEGSFIEILKQLPPTHALVLDVYYEQIERSKLPQTDWAEKGFILSVLKSYLTDKVPNFDLAIDNLLRLRLVAYPTAKLGIANGNEVRFQVTSSDLLCPTALGNAFVTACGRGRGLRSHSYCVPSNSISNLYQTKGGSLPLSDRAPVWL